MELDDSPGGSRLIPKNEASREDLSAGSDEEESDEQLEDRISDEDDDRSLDSIDKL
jgi:hypothetical protein